MVLVASLMSLAANTAIAAYRLQCEDFKNDPDGSWTNSKPVDAAAPDSRTKALHFTAGLTFEEGNMIDGLDVAEVLSERCR